MFMAVFNEFASDGLCQTGSGMQAYRRVRVPVSSTFQTRNFDSGRLIPPLVENNYHHRLDVKVILVSPFGLASNTWGCLCDVNTT